MEDAHTFDAEDVPVLFELVRRGALPIADKLPFYDHIVVDEAQLRAPLELAAIGDALAPGGTITLAGDHRQATDETAYFAGWAAARAEVRGAALARGHARGHVPLGARDRRARGKTWKLPAEPPDDPAVWASRCDDGLAQAAQICWHLDALADPRSVAPDRGRSRARPSTRAGSRPSSRAASIRCWCSTATSGSSPA